MKTLNPNMRPADLPRHYAKLVELHPPRPIHDEVAYDNTVEIIDALAGHKLNTDQEDYLELLSRLVETYEDQNVAALPTGSASERLKFLLSEHDLSGEDLAELLGVDRSTAYKLLKGGRNLTTEHIRALAKRFKVSTDLFID